MDQQTYQYFDPNAQQMKQRKLIRLIIILIPITLVIWVLTMVFSPESPSAGLGLVMAREQELVRIIDETRDSARSVSSADFIATTRSVLASNINQFSSAGISPSPDQTQQAALPNAVGELEDSSLNGRYDQDMLDFIDKVLRANQQELTSIIPSLSGETADTANDILGNYSALID